MRYNSVYPAKYEPHKRKSARKKTLETTTEFCDATSIHGFAYIFHERNSTIDRIFWSIVVILALSFTAYQVIVLYLEWQDEPVITTLETVAQPIEEIDFPAVTICPQGSRQEIVDSVLFRQLREYIRIKEGDGSVLTPDLMMEHVDQFLKDTYPGANGKPTQLVKLLSSDNPALLIQNDAILGLEEKCDSSGNQEILDSMNKHLSNDTCPEGFKMLADLYCIHVSDRKLTYSGALDYCNQREGSEVLHLESNKDLIELLQIPEIENVLKFDPASLVTTSPATKITTSSTTVTSPSTTLKNDNEVTSLGQELSEWLLIADKAECNGSETPFYGISTVDECSQRCKGQSSMFAFGTNDYGETRCYSAGCTCLCETAASSDGTCSQASHNGYRLYKYKTDALCSSEWTKINEKCFSPARKTHELTGGNDCNSNCLPIEEACSDAGALLATKEETQSWLNNGGDRLGMEYGLTSTRNGQQHWFTQNNGGNGLWYAGCCQHNNRFFVCVKNLEAIPSTSIEPTTPTPIQKSTTVATSTIAGGCSCSSHIIWHYGLDYGNCKREHGTNGKGKFCYVNLPTTCSDAEQSSADPTKKMSWEACQYSKRRKRSAENDQGTFSGTWLLSTQKTEVEWYNVLSKMSSLVIDSQNNDIFINGLTTGECISMQKDPDSDDKFKLNVDDCNNKRRTICRIDTPTIAAPSKPSKFPCLDDAVSSRIKRHTNDDQQLPNTTYGGYCRDPQYDKSIIDFIPVTDVQECHIKCRNTNDCAAFAFNSKNTAGLPNCDLYRGGPYMQGTGASRIICYVFQELITQKLGGTWKSRHGLIWSCSKISYTQLNCDGGKVTIDGGDIVFEMGTTKLTGIINSFDEISWKNGDFWLREDGNKLSVSSTDYLSSTAKLPFSSSAKSVTTEGMIHETNSEMTTTTKATHSSKIQRVETATVHESTTTITTGRLNSKPELSILNETVRQVIETIDVSINPTKDEQRLKKKKESIENYEDSFGSLDMDKSYFALFELLWYSQMPCFDVKGLTSEAKDEISFLKRCYWKERRINCTAIFQQRPTDQGMCCTFNMKKAEEILKKSRYTDAIHVRQFEDAKSAFEPDGLPEWYNESEEPRPEAGRNKGLMLIVDGHSHQQSSGTVRENFNGFITLVDDKSKYPMVSSANMITRPGHETNIKIKAINLEARDEIRKYEPAKRNCYFPDEYELDIHQNYSQFNCLFECETKFASQCLSTCNKYNETCDCKDMNFRDNNVDNSTEICIPWFYPVRNDTSIQMCNPWNTQKFLEILEKQIPKDQCNHCLPDCATVKYDAVMTYANLRKCDRTNIGGTSMLCALVDGPMNPAPWMSTAQDEFINANQTVPWYLDTDATNMDTNVRQFPNMRRDMANHMFPSQSAGNLYYDAYKKDIGILNIFFSEKKILKYATKNRMSNFDFLSQIGGSLGLAMGISIISVIEVVYWFAFRLFK